MVILLLGRRYRKDWKRGGSLEREGQRMRIDEVDLIRPGKYRRRATWVPNKTHVIALLSYFIYVTAVLLPAYNLYIF